MTDDFLEWPFFDDSHRELAPVRDRVIAFVLAHLGEVMVVALGQSGDGGIERLVGEQVFGSRHAASLG